MRNMSKSKRTCNLKQKTRLEKVMKKGNKSTKLYQAGKIAGNRAWQMRLDTRAEYVMCMDVCIVNAVFVR